MQPEMVDPNDINVIESEENVNKLMVLPYHTYEKTYVTKQYIKKQKVKWPLYN